MVYHGCDLLSPWFVLAGWACPGGQSPHQNNPKPPISTQGAPPCGRGLSWLWFIVTMVYPGRVGVSGACLGAEPGVLQALAGRGPAGGLEGQHGPQEAGKGGRRPPRPLVLLLQHRPQPPGPQVPDVPQLTWGRAGSGAGPGRDTPLPCGTDL